MFITPTYPMTILIFKHIVIVWGYLSYILYLYPTNLIHDAIDMYLEDSMSGREERMRASLWTWV